MSTTVFTFVVSRPYYETFGYRTLTSTAEGGREVRLAKVGADGILRVAPAIILLASAKNDVTDFLDFFEARKGGFDTFLFKPLLTRHNSIADEDIGTGDGAEDEFALDLKFIDASSLIVEIDASPTAAYTLSGNNTAPLITFDSAPSLNEALTASYDFYVPCRFDQDILREQFRAVGSTDDEHIIRVRSLTWQQDYSGSHKV